MDTCTHPHTHINMTHTYTHMQTHAHKDLRKEALLSGKQQPYQQQQTTPKRPMSPLKRFNKVAPTPVPATPTKPKSSQPPPGSEGKPTSPLHSSSTSILDDRVRRDEKEVMLVGARGQGRPGSAPMAEGQHHGMSTSHVGMRHGSYGDEAAHSIYAVWVVIAWN